MDIQGRIYRRGEQPHSVLSQRFGPNAFNRYFYIKIGVITDVDYDRYQLQVTWVNQDGAHPKVPITFPYAGPAGCMGMMPEIGSIGVFGFFDEGDGKGSPLCLAHLPSGLYNALNHNTVKILPDAFPTNDVNEIAHHFRPLREGDMICTSPKGSGLFLNDSVELYDNLGDMIMIREGDQSILQTSMNNYLFADGASICLGPAVRNGLILFDSAGNKIPDIPANSINLPNGKQTIYMVPFGNDITNDTQFYTEFRVDVDDYGDGKLDMNDINEEGLLSVRDPVVTMALGNYIGANSKDENLYGRIIKALLFDSPQDDIGNFTLASASQNNGLNEPEILGFAYALHFQKSGAFIGVDKEGHYYMNLPPSKSNTLGAGRSMSVLAQGNLKEIWGPDADSNNAWDLTAHGGIKWDVGKHSTSYQGFGNTGASINIRTESGVYIEINGADDSGLAKTEVVSGDSSESCGNKIVGTDNYDLTVRGMKTENINGSYSGTFQMDHSVNILGVSSEIALIEKQCKFGKRKTTITAGNDELTLLLGSIMETITAGSRKTAVTVGSVNTDITSGSCTTSVTAGKHSVTVTAGTISQSASAGSISLSALSAQIKGTVSTSVESPIVKLGNNAPIGGVIAGLPGIPTHFDYTTGAALKGSMSVSIST